MMDKRELLVLSRRECIAYLQGQNVGRVVFTERALPAVMPVSYAVLDDALVMSTAAGSRLAVAARGGVLAFEVDHLDPVTRTGWSVVVTALPEAVIAPQDRARVSLVLDSWAPGSHDLLLRLPLTVITGRRIESTPALVPPGIDTTYEH